MGTEEMTTIVKGAVSANCTYCYSGKSDAMEPMEPCGHSKTALALIDNKVAIHEVFTYLYTERHSCVNIVMALRGILDLISERVPRCMADAKRRTTENPFSPSFVQFIA